MNKSLSALHELLDRLYHLKANAALSKSAVARRRLRKRLTDGVDDLMRAVGEFSPEVHSESNAQAIEEQVLEFRQIRKKAEELRRWISSHPW